LSILALLCKEVQILQLGIRCKKSLGKPHNFDVKNVVKRETEKREF
jgi:hypothetical protein